MDSRACKLAQANVNGKRSAANSNSDTCIAPKKSRALSNVDVDCPLPPQVSAVTGGQKRLWSEECVRKEEAVKQVFAKVESGNVRLNENSCFVLRQMKGIVADINKQNAEKAQAETEPLLTDNQPTIKTVSRLGHRGDGG